MEFVIEANKRLIEMDYFDDGFAEIFKRLLDDYRIDVEEIKIRRIKQAVPVPKTKQEKDQEGYV
jgi:hypothetical protein